MPPTPPDAQHRTVARAPAVGRSFTRWTPDDLEAAEAMTAGGHLAHAAALCWALLGDGRVKAALDTRVKGLLRLPMKWETPPGGEAIKHALEADGDWYAMHSEAALFSLFAWGLLLGVGIAQRVWELRGDRWIGVLRPYDARLLRWDPHTRRWLVRTEAGEVSIERGDKRWVLYAPSCAGHPDGDERPWMYGAWRSCGAPWLGKYFAWGDWQGYGQVHGAPIRTADVEDAAFVPKPDKMAELGDALGDVGGDACVIPPPGAKVRLVEALGNTWQTFKESIASASLEIVIALTGQSSSTEIAEGQETGATLHGQVRRDLIGADEQTGSTCTHGLIEDYAEVNWGDRTKATWARWDITPPSDAKARGDAMLALGAGIASLEAVLPAGKILDRASEFERAGVQLLDAPTVPAPTVPAPTATLAATRTHRHPVTRKDERPIAGNTARPGPAEAGVLWAYRLNRDDIPGVCPTRVCDDLRDIVRPSDDRWWHTHTPPMHFRCNCYIEALPPESDARPTPTAALDDLAGPSEGFGDGTIPLEPDDERHAKRLDTYAARELELPASAMGRPPRDGGSGRLYNPALEAPARVVPRRSLEVGAASASGWPGGWAAWDSASRTDRALAVLIVAWIVWLAADALDDALDDVTVTPGAQRILDTEDGRLRSAVVEEAP